MAKDSPPPQTQDRQPGIESKMRPRPESRARDYRPAGKLAGKAALISGGDSGIGRSVAVHFAKEGADVAILYFDEHGDAEETKRLVEAEGRTCVTIAGDVGSEAFCREAVARAVEELGRLDILVNNAAEQHEVGGIEDVTEEQLTRVFRTNIFGYFFLTKAALPHLRDGSTIVNTTSVTAYRGSSHLLDYSATKGAIVAFTRSLAQTLAGKGIRVNGVAPGPIWTPLIPASFDAKSVGKFGESTLLERPGQPDEVAPTYVFLASEDSSFYVGQILHPNGGDYVST